MPGSVIAMTPTAVLPETLSRAFTESHTYAANVAEFHDGSCQQGALALAQRRTWRLTKKLPPADLVTLFNFLQLHIVDTFYFYNPKECSPINTGDPTGVSITGRYAVRLNSNWIQSTGIALTESVIELIEVAQ